MCVFQRRINTASHSVQGVVSRISSEACTRHWTSVRELAVQAAATPPRFPHSAVVCGAAVTIAGAIRPLFIVIDQWCGCSVANARDNAILQYWSVPNI